MGQNDAGLEFLKIVIESHSKEYADISETWRHLDTKAQGAAAIAGVFIAGVFAFLARSGSPGAPFLRVALVVAIVLLLAAVALSLWSLRLRELERPPVGSSIGEQVSDLLDDERAHELGERLPRFLSDQAAAWSNANAKAWQINSEKATHLRTAQWLLGGAMLAVAVFTIGVVFDP